LGFWASAPALPATWGRKKNFETWDFAKIVVKKNFSLFYLASPEIIGVKFRDRQSHEFLDTIYGRVCVFFSSQNFLPPYSRRSQGIIKILNSSPDKVL
jgi:hypothetical protein